MSSIRRSTRTKTTAKRSYADFESESDDELIKPSNPDSKRRKITRGNLSDTVEEDRAEATQGRRNKIKGIAKARSKAPKAKHGGKSGASGSGRDSKLRNTRGKCGMLQKVAEFPLDLLYEVHNCSNRP